MDVEIVLDPHNQVLTTGDAVTGRVVVSVKKKSSITSVDVKLKGWIKTSLLSDNDMDTDTWKPYHDKHEFLRLSQTLLPQREVRSKSFWGSSVTLSAGQHDFPFEFRLPMSTTCGKKTRGESDDENKGKCPRAPTHNEKGLPPSFTGASDEVEIAYCIKATVGRPDLFKDNLHTTYHFNFRPIEQAWDPVPRLTSVKHQHQFDLQRVVPASPSEASTTTTATSADDDYFPDMIREPAAAPAADRELASILVDARLPKPAILFCNHDVPLDITIRKVNAFGGQLYLQSLQITLIGYTQLATQGGGSGARRRRKVDTWVVMSASNLDMPVGYPDDGSGARMALPPTLWRCRPLPQHAGVTPSFDVCGVSRAYELEVMLGLTYESPRTQRPGTAWLPLRLPVDVYPDFPALPSPANISLEKLAAAEAEGYAKAPPSYEVATASPC